MNPKEILITAARLREESDRPMRNGFDQTHIILSRLTRLVEQMAIASYGMQEDTEQGLRKAIDLLETHRDQIHAPGSTAGTIHDCVTRLRDALGERHDAPGVAYVAIFTSGIFYRLGPQVSMEAAKAYAEGVNDCADHLDETNRVKAYVMPFSGSESIRPLELRKAEEAWATAIQSDQVAQQKDGT